MSVATPRHVHVVRPVPRPPPPPPTAPARTPPPLLPRALRRELRVLRAREMLRRGVSEPRDRPRFISTVKTGQYLLPPPQLASLLGLEALYPARDRDRLVYSYASRPKAVGSRAAPAAPAPPAPPAPAAREHAGHAGSVGPAHYSNVMHDKRIVRGSTFAAHPHAAGDGAESAAARLARTRRRSLARRAAQARLRPGTPPPAPGRRHHPVQTEYYLEELFDKGVELEVGVQTDLFVDRPGTPVYVPAKTGADAHTQIYPGDLFDFELEVQPILEALVGKTCEQALAEVAQEEELGALREQQRRYCELRDAERAERHRLAAQHRRLHEERERRVAEARGARRGAARGAGERVAAATLVRAHVADLLPAVLAGLRAQGYLLDRLQRGVDEELMPWLVREVTDEIESIISSRDVIAEIVRDVVEARAELFASAAESGAAAGAPPDSITPPSPPDPDPEEQSQLEE